MNCKTSFRKTLAGTCALLALTVGAVRADILASGTVSPPLLGPGNTDVGNSPIVVGSGGVGSLTVQGGSQLRGAALYAGNPFVGGTGLFTVNGAGSIVTLNGTNNRLAIGDGGFGQLTIVNGGIVDADAPCAPQICNSFIGAWAGATGTVIVNGAGSRLETTNYLGVGHAAIFGAAGIPGGTAVGTLQLTGGGVVTASRLDVAVHLLFADARGTESIIANTIVSGAGSLLDIASANTGLAIGAGSNSSGTLSIGNGGAATINATSGSSFLQVGGAFGLVGGTGALTVDAIGSSLVIRAVDFSAIHVGNSSGVGTLTLSNGGTVSGAQSVVVGQNQANGTVDVLGGGILKLEPTPNHSTPGIQIGGAFGAAGGTGAVNVSGAGSKIDLGGGNAFLNVGNNSGTASLTIASGGVVNGLKDITVAQNGASAKVLVDGTGSSLTLAGSHASLTVGRGGSGSVEVREGGIVRLLDTSTDFGSRLFIAEGTGSRGSVLVSGAGSRIETTSKASGLLEVGNGIDSAAALRIENGGLVQGISGRVASAIGSTGDLIVTGPGSRLDLAGVRADGFGSYLTIGHQGFGTLQVANGGVVSIDGRGGLAGSVLVGRLAGATGIASITGAGSEVKITGNQTDGTNGVGMSVGRSGAVGLLTIADGGRLTIIDESAAGTGGVSIGGSSGQAAAGDPAGTGSISVVGAGSRIDLIGNRVGLTVGRSAGASGSLAVQNGAAVAATSLTVGRDAGAVGTAVFSGSDTRLKLASNAAGALLDVGRNGIGVMSLAGGASATLTGTDAKVIVGNAGTGSLSLSASSTLDNADGKTFVGMQGSGSGSVTLTGGSTLDAGSFLGIGHDGIADTGRGSVVLRNDSKLIADEIVVGANGSLGGTGTIVGNISNSGGMLSPGNSPGRLHITGDYLQDGGRILLEVESDGAGGFVTDVIVFDTGASIAISDAEIAFAFIGGVDPSDFAASGLFKLGTFFRLTDGTSENPLSMAGALSQFFTSITYSALSDAFPITHFVFDTNLGLRQLGAVAVPEPGMLSLFVVGILGLVWRRYRRREYRGRA